MKVVSLLVLMVGIVVAQAAQTPDVVGTWEMTTNSPLGTTMNTLIISKDGDKLKALAKGERGERAYDSLEVQGSQVTLVLTIDFQGMPMVITYSGRIDKDGMSGDADFGGQAQGTWSAVRKNP